MTRLCPSGAGPAWYPHSYIKSPRRCSTAMSSHAARFHVSGSASYVVLPGYGPCDSSKIGFARRSPSTGLKSAGVDGNSCDSGGGPRGGSISASAIWSIGRGRRAGAKGLLARQSPTGRRLFIWAAIRNSAQKSWHGVHSGVATGTSYFGSFLFAQVPKSQQNVSSSGL